MKIDFYLPVKVISGIDCVINNPDCFKLGDTCIIVTGGSSAIKSGALDDVVELLCDLGIDYVVYDKTHPNPLLSESFDGGQLAFSVGAEFVIAIGGGSPLDSAKAIAAYAANPNIGPEDLFNPKKLKPSLPIIAIPTTAGTGSEVNPYSVLTLDNENRKKTFNSINSYPKYAFLDPKYTYTLPFDVTVSCVLDAFCHCIESYNSPKSTYFSELAAVFGAKKIWRELDCLENKTEISPKVRERFLNAACAGGVAINTTGTAFPHPMGYNLTFESNIPHGKACAVFIGKFIDHCMKTSEGQSRMTKFALKIGATPEEIKSRIPRLAGLNLKYNEEQIDRFVQTISEAKNFANSNNPVNLDDVKRIYQELFS